MPGTTKYNSARWLQFNSEKIRCGLEVLPRTTDYNSHLKLPFNSVESRYTLEVLPWTTDNTIASELQLKIQ